ncbi:MAG: hypothetical protein ABEJ22_09450 [Haloferacaceae archaeon]
MSVDGASGSGELTLAFSLSAIGRLEDPAAAFEEARRWSRFVGVVDNDTDEVERTVEEYGLRQDFDLGGRDKWLAMEEIRAATDTPRHVYVGETPEDRRVATQLGWEFVPTTEAAEKAGWTLSSGDSGGGIVARFLRALPGLRSPGSE